MEVGLNHVQIQTDEFHKTFGHEVNFHPKSLTLEKAQKRANYIQEELVEFLHASTNNKKDFAEACKVLLKKIEEAYDKEKVKEHPQGEVERIVAQSDALTDINYFVSGTFTMNGVKPQPLMDIVQEANMSKLDENGKPIYREDGKIMKPEGWEPPEPKLKKEIIRQLTVV